MRSVLDRLLALESRVRGIPSRFAGGTAPVVYILRMGGGNLVATYGAQNYYGIKYPTNDVTSVPTSAPSTTDGATPNQIGPAYLYASDGTTTTVWAGNGLVPTPTTPRVNGMLSLVPKGTVFMATKVVPMQVGTSGVFVPVYLPERVT